MTLIIILFILAFLTAGFIKIRTDANRHVKKYNFAIDFREKFISLSNNYSRTYDDWHEKGQVDNQLYVWLTKNVNKMQSDMGYLGRLEYMAPFQRYTVKNYQILINTLPKFRNGQVEDFDINSSDDCLVRYIGVLEEILEDDNRNLKNPIIWFKMGFHEFMSLPLLLFSWFGIISATSVSKFMGNTVYKVITGIVAFVAFASGIVTIIQGKDATLLMLYKLIGK